MSVAKFCEVLKDCPNYFFAPHLNTLAIYFSAGKVIHFMPEKLMFCTCICLLQHAGGTPENAGEIVRVENGMSIAQWFKFCIGVSIFFFFFFAT